MDGTLREWNFTTGKSRVLLGPQVTKGSLLYFALNAEERSVAVLNAFGKMSAVELQTLALPKGNKADREAVPGFFYWDAAELSYADKKGWHTWDTTRGSGSGGPLILKPNTTGTPRSIVMAPDLSFGAVLCTEGIVATFRIPPGGGRGRFPGPIIDFDATTAAFSKDASLILLGAKDGSLGLYRTGAATPKDVVTLKGHTALVRCAVFTPDGKKVITGGDDRLARVWDVATGKELQQFPHLGAVTGIVVTPDNRYAISASADAILRMWKLPAEK
jgi:WD40 repeat protein